jgi:thiol-disulfide isomerase/thioredoxin
MSPVQIAIVAVIMLVIVYLWTKSEHFYGDNGKPFLVLFSQDWCPACKEFKPTWDRLKTIKAVTDVVTIVQLDPLPYNIGTFPTIRFYKKDPEQYPNDFVLFKGQRNLGQLMKFVRDNSISK